MGQQGTRRPLDQRTHSAKRQQEPEGQPQMKRSLRDPSATVHGIADPAFACDERQRIVAWNRAAEQLLGRAASEVRGRPCHEILCGTDLFGNRMCDEACTFNRMARRGEPIASFEMGVRTADGSRVRVAVSALVLPDRIPSRWLMIHIFRPIGRDSETGELLRRLIGWAAASSGPGSPQDRNGPSQPALTNREIEVLRLLAEGMRTEDLADTLSVSVATVRTHIRNILTKIEAHSRLEAVAKALKKRLI